MGLETTTVITGLVATNPVGSTDTPSTLDGHIQLIKSVLQADAFGASTVHAATSKTTPVDNDELPITDSAASYGKKKLTWANLKATAKTYFDTLYQAYDADTAKLDVAQTFTASQRGTLTTDNDGSFDQSVTNNFFCTPAGNVTLTFTNHTSGQSGFVLFANTGGYTGHALAATTKADTSFLTTINATGTYLISYFDNGTNAYVTTTKALA